MLWWRVRLFDRHRHGRLVLEQVEGLPILVLPQVFNPKLFRTGELFVAAFTGRLIPFGSTVLDLGTGSGVGAIAAARWAERVVAVDVSPEAVRCARLNVLLNRVEDRVDVREGDLFAPVAGERFDVVLFNPPYFRGSPRDLLDRAWRSNDAVERFAAGLDAHLTDRGHALVILSSDGDSETFLRVFRECGFDIGAELRRDLINEVVTVYRLSRGPALSEGRSEDAPC
ncbi:MAG: methyltransferase [Chloroflexi bacterium]|nr:methyltransferase [Chloroflexota bacterium]